MLQSFELTNLHGGRRGQDIGSLPHQTSSVDFGAGGNDLRFTNSLLLSGRGERCRDLGTEDDIFDEDTFNGDTPLVGDIADDFCNFVGDGFTFSDNALDSTGTDDVTEGGLGSLNERLTKISDAEGCAVGVGDLEVDYGVTINRSFRWEDAEKDSGKTYISTFTLSLVLCRSQQKHINEIR